MGFYIGKYAEYYDIIYQDKPYAQEANFIQDLLTRYCPNNCTQLLELACGTGRHAFELEKFGHEIVAIDYSSDLLDIAHSNANKQKSNIEFILQDMRKFSLPGRKFDAAYCLFDSIGYVQTNSAIGQVLDSVHTHLKSQGVFIFEFWHAAAMLKYYEPQRERRWNLPGGELLRIAETKLDIPKQLAEVTYTITETVDGKVNQIVETQVNRYFLVQEMAFFLESNHFAPIDFLPAYEAESQIDENTWHIMAVARRMEI